MRVQWTDNAIAHLVDIYDYIAINSPGYAKRIVDKITRQVRTDSEFSRFRP